MTLEGLDGDEYGWKLIPYSSILSEVKFGKICLAMKELFPHRYNTS
jgi:hypothetical protein